MLHNIVNNTQRNRDKVLVECQISVVAMECTGSYRDGEIKLYPEGSVDSCYIPYLALSQDPPVRLHRTPTRPLDFLSNIHPPFFVLQFRHATLVYISSPYSTLDPWV